MGLTVAIVGRPNVGKSTLFNRLIGRRVALVDDAPGVTRDRRAGEARIGDFRFTVVDTAGLDDAAGASLAGRMRRQTEQAVLNADLVLFLIDARAGVMPLDEHYANWLRKAGRPVILLANKAEGRAAEPGIAEAFGLGFGEPVAVSAEHGDGMAELYAAITQMPDDGAAEQPSAEAAGEPEKPLQLAIVGRPNVGKSTLVNRLIGEERLLTGPEPGITRDAIAVAWRHHGRRIRLIDTAGLRRRPHVVDKLEKLSMEDALRGIRFAQVVILVIDANDMLEKQDLAIARLVVEEGRAMVVAANKWDIVEDKAAAGERLRDRLEVSLPQSRGIAVVMISAHTGYNVDRLLDAALAAYDVWNRRVATPEVNRWLEAMVGAHPPPLVRGRRIKLRYMAQIKTRPPTFALFGNQLDQLPDAYLRYLESGLREHFDLPGVPIRLQVRRGKNPYVGRS